MSPPWPFISCFLLCWCQGEHHRLEQIVGIAPALAQPPFGGMQPHHGINEGLRMEWPPVSPPEYALLQAAGIMEL